MPTDARVSARIARRMFRPRNSSPVQVAVTPAYEKRLKSISNPFPAASDKKGLPFFR